MSTTPQHAPTENLNPPGWTDLVEYHTRQGILQGKTYALAEHDARELVFAHCWTRAAQSNDQYGPWHYRASAARGLECGLRPGVMGAHKWTTDPRLVQCALCRDALTHGSAAPILADIADREAAAERYMVEVLGVPEWATPSATERTPLHPLTVQLSVWVHRRQRLLERLGTGLETQQGQAQRAREHVQSGILPPVKPLDVDLADEASCGYARVEVMDTVLRDMAATVTAVCGQVDRWLKAEAATVTAPTGAAAVIAAAEGLRDLHGLPAGTRAHGDARGALNDAVDGYRAERWPTGPVDDGTPAVAS